MRAKNIYRSKNIILIISLLFMGCTRYWYKPYGRLFDTMPKGGTPGFNLGWQHGCESGLATQFGGAMYQSFYTWKKDPEIMASEPDLEKIRNKYRKELNIDWNNHKEIAKNLSDYKKAHPAAYVYCKHTVVGLLQTAGMNPPLAGEARWDPASSNLGNVYRIDGRGDARWSSW